MKSKTRALSRVSQKIAKEKREALAQAKELRRLYESSGSDLKKNKQRPTRKRIRIAA